MHAIREGPMGEHQESAMLPTPLLGFQDGSIYQLPSANSSIQAGNSQRPTREPRSQTDGISPSRKASLWQFLVSWLWFSFKGSSSIYIADRKFGKQICVPSFW